jgi:hypothetical protein
MSNDREHASACWIPLYMLHATNLGGGSDNLHSPTPACRPLPYVERGWLQRSRHQGIRRREEHGGPIR